MLRKPLPLAEFEQKVGGESFKLSGLNNDFKIMNHRRES